MSREKAKLIDYNSYCIVLLMLLFQGHQKNMDHATRGGGILSSKILRVPAKNMKGFGRQNWQKVVDAVGIEPTAFRIPRTAKRMLYPSERFN